MKFYDNEGSQDRKATKIAVAMYSIKLCFLHWPKPGIKESGKIKEGGGGGIAKLLPTKPKTEDMSY